MPKANPIDRIDRIYGMLFLAEAQSNAENFGHRQGFACELRPCKHTQTQPLLEINMGPLFGHPNN